MNEAVMRPAIGHARGPGRWSDWFTREATSVPCADSSTTCARRQVTTDPLPRRTTRATGPAWRISTHPASARPAGQCDPSPGRGKR
jgi:hypothetical protein